MARSYRARDDGLFEVETPGLGYVPVHWGEDQLRAQGLEPLAPPEGRTAFIYPTKEDLAAGGGTPPPAAGGQTREAAPKSRSDVEPGPAGWSEEDSMAAVRRVAGVPEDTPVPVTRNDGPAHTTSTRFDQLSKLSESVANKPKEKEGPKTEEYRPGAGASAAGQRGGGPRYAKTKARDERVAWRVDKGPQLDHENEEFRSEAEIDTRLSMQEQADREEQRALQNVEQYEKRVLAPMQRQVSADELKLDRMRQEYAKRQGEIDREREAIDKLEVNPREIFEGKEWASVLAGLSILAGGALQGLQGRGDNPGLTAVNSAIDRSIQNQKDKIARRREGLQGKETALEKLMATYGNPEMAEAELRNRMSSLAEAWAKHHLMKGAAEDVQGNLQQAFNQRDLARVEERRQLDQAFGDRISEQWQHVPAQTVQVGGQRPRKPEERKRMVTLPDGRRVFTTDETSKERIQKTITSNDMIARNAERIRHLMKQPGAQTDPALRGEIEAASADLFIALKDGANLGTLDKGSLDFREEWTGNPSDLVHMGGVDAKLGEVGRSARNRINTAESYELYIDPDATTPVRSPGPASARSDE